MRSGKFYAHFEAIDSPKSLLMLTPRSHIFLMFFSLNYIKSVKNIENQTAGQLMALFMTYYTANKSYRLNIRRIYNP